MFVDYFEHLANTREKYEGPIESAENAIAEYGKEKFYRAKSMPSLSLRGLAADIAQEAWEQNLEPSDAVEEWVLAETDDVCNDWC